MPVVTMPNHPSADFCLVKNNSIYDLKINDTKATSNEISFVNSSECSQPCPNISLPTVLRPNTTYTFKVASYVNSNLTHLSPLTTFKIGKCQSNSTNITSINENKITHKVKQYQLNGLSFDVKGFNCLHQDCCHGIKYRLVKDGKTIPTSFMKLEEVKSNSEYPDFRITLTNT